MEEADFLPFWWEVNNAPLTHARKLLIRSKCVQHRFFVSQVVSLIRIFDRETDKLEVLEVLVNRIVDPHEKPGILGVFDTPSTQERVQEILGSIYAPAEPIRLPLFLLENYSARNYKQMSDILDNIQKSDFSSNQLEILTAAVNTDRAALNFEQVN